MIPVTFQTGCYEADWQILLRGNYLEKKIAACSYPFTKKNLFINNVSDRTLVSEACERLKNSGVIDAYYFSEDFIDEALRHFHLTRADLGTVKQSYFSLYEFVGMYLCETPYLLSFKDDAYMNIQGGVINTNWVNFLLDELEKSETYVTANPRWSNRGAAKKEARGMITDDGFFYLSQAFSDQCFLCKTAVFKGDVYRYEHVDSNRFPLYAGNSFERRVNSFLNTAGFYRLTAKDIRFIHCDFPRERWKRKMLAFSALHFGYTVTNRLNSVFRILSFQKLIQILKRITYIALKLLRVVVGKRKENKL